MADMHPYDVVVIGSGPGGERAAATAAFFGKHVAVVEKNAALGGVSANTGTVPSKTLRETALALSGLKARQLYGVDLSLRREATIRDFMHHEQQVREAERARVRAQLQLSGADVYRGVASFLDPHTIRVAADPHDEETLTAELVLIATGSSPVRPPGIPFDDDRVHDSDEILELERLSGSLAVVGAGVVGSEYACTFAALGVEVHLVDGRDTLLPFLDAEFSKALHRAMEHLGIHFHWNETVAACDVDKPGKVGLLCQSGRALLVDDVLVAAGRRSNVEALNLAAAGLSVGARGLISVDERFRTAVPHIYAVGDVIGFPALAATSAEQGRVAMCYACDQPAYAVAAPILPTGIYTIPEVSMVGQTEESLKQQGVDYVAGRAKATENARGMIIGDREGLLKLLFRRDDMKLLGAHVIGEHASETIHIGLLTMVAGQGATLLLETCFNYPTLGDLYKLATYRAVAARERHT